jgi:hypothetical protein
MFILVVCACVPDGEEERDGLWGDDVVCMG